MIPTAVRRWLARHRRSLPGRGAAALGRELREACGNLDYDPRTNGERFVLEAMAPDRPAVVLDAGANRGDWARLALAALPETAVHCFEAHPGTAEHLRAALGATTRVTVNAFGLSDRPGKVRLRCFAGASELSTMTDFPHAHPTGEVEAEVAAGDDYLATAGIERVDFLKIDVEGAEHLVLDGLSRAINGRRIGAIQFEYGSVNILTRVMLRDFYARLEAAGFLVGKVYPNFVDFRPYRLTDEDFLGPNYLAVQRDRTGLISRLG